MPCPLRFVLAGASAALALYFCLGGRSGPEAQPNTQFQVMYQSKQQLHAANCDTDTRRAARSQHSGRVLPPPSPSSLYHQERSQLTAFPARKRGLTLRTSATAPATSAGAATRQVGLAAYPARLFHRKIPIPTSVQATAGGAAGAA